MRRLLGEYRSSLKAVEVEEPIDLAVHRPLAFVVAKLAASTSLTPNHLTYLSLALGVAAGITLFGGTATAALAAGGLLFLSQVVDCSDGMLARMRKSSSEFGRMLDGSSDAVTLGATIVASVWWMVRMYPEPLWAPGVVLAVSALTVHTGSFHTAGYDHYKNLHLALTTPGSREETLEAAVARLSPERLAKATIPFRLVAVIYLGYLRGQRRFLSWYDPHTPLRYDQLPAFDPDTAAIYRKHTGRLLDVWRSFFGVGSLVFGLAFFVAIGRPDLFMILRVVFLNALFFGWLMPMQRKASRAIARELGLSESGGYAAVTTASEAPSSH